MEIVIEKEKSRVDLDTLKINGFYVHSKYNPLKEAQTFAEKEFRENYVHVLFGYGLGYIAEELKKKVKDVNELIIVEPLKKDLCNENDNIVDFSNKKLLEEIINKAILKKNSRIKVVCNPNYEKIFENHYIELLSIVKEVQLLDRNNTYTVEFFAENWQENYLKNLLLAGRDYKFEEIENKYNCPIVIASGGPSLTKQIELLKAYKDKIIIIAAGSTINSLLNFGVEPDFVVSVDGGENNFNHFKDIKDINTVLLYCLSSHYKIQYNFKGKKIPFIITKDRYINEMLPNNDLQLKVFSGGTSVANFAFEIAQSISSGPIALIGQDLAYTNNWTHAEANKHANKIDEDFIKTKGLLEIDGYYGGKVLSDNAFISMKKAFEKLLEISKHPSSIYNCTEGGAKIDGFEQISFKEFLEEYTYTPVEKINITKNIKNNVVNQVLDKYRLYLDDFNNLEKQLNKVVVLIKKEKNNRVFSNALNNQLSKIDDSINKIFERGMFSHILQPIVNRILSDFVAKSNETEKEKFDRVYLQTLYLYNSLLKSITSLQKYLKESINLK